MPTKTTTKRVIDLRVGDILSSGAEVTHGPYDSVKCPKGKINIGIRYPNETEGYRRVWGKYTEVGVVRPMTTQEESDMMTARYANEPKQGPFTPYFDETTGLSY